MKEIYKELAEKFLEVKNNPKLCKRFSFSMEDLQDNPEVVEEIVDYLELHKGKYQDYRVIKWIDEATFSPRVMLEITPTELYLESMRSEYDNFVNYFYQKHEEQFEIVRIKISHEEVQNLHNFDDMDTALDYLLEVYKITNDKNKFHSAEIITEDNFKPQLTLKFLK